MSGLNLSFQVLYLSKPLKDRIKIQMLYQKNTKIDRTEEHKPKIFERFGRKQ